MAVHGRPQKRPEYPRRISAHGCRCVGLAGRGGRRRNDNLYRMVLGRSGTEFGDRCRDPDRYVGIVKGCDTFVPERRAGTYRFAGSAAVLIRVAGRRGSPGSAYLGDEYD